MEIRKEEEEKLSEEEEKIIEQNMTEEEKERIEEIEAKSRQTFDPEERIYDARKRRVTDLKENARVTLPKPAGTAHEAGIEMRRNMFNKTVKEFIESFCDEGGEQESNLSEQEKRGLRSLRKRIQSGELLVIKTDKSGKFAIIDKAHYLEIGKMHTKNDKEIGRKEIVEREKVINGHARMWCMMTQAGEHFDHEERIMTSKTTKSNNLSSLYFLLKDHKLTLAARPVVTDCNGNSLGLSNSVSDFLESIANSIREAYEVLSSKDLLARYRSVTKEFQQG